MSDFNFNFGQMLMVGDQLDENIIYTEKVNEIVPLTDTSSIANDFSFFSSSSVPTSASANIIENGSNLLTREKLMKNFFLDDLKCMLRWCISIK